MISPQALIATIKVNCQRRPLWCVETVSDFLDISRSDVRKRIDSGELPFAFDVGRSKRFHEERILALSVVEQQIGPIPGIGETRNLKLPEVINLILPARDIRSTELKRILQVGNDWSRRTRPQFVTVRRPKVRGGPNSYHVFQRDSVANWLTQKLIS